MERAPLFILDASVAVKWFVDESDRDSALKVREDYVHDKIDLSAPELIIYEVGNALRFHPNATERVGAQGVKSLYKMQFHLKKLQDRVVERAMQIAHSEDITFYDATYLALAIEHDSKVITADEHLTRQLKRHAERTLLLKDYPSLNDGVD